MLQWMRHGLQDWIRRQVDASKYRIDEELSGCLVEDSYDRQGIRQMGKRFSIHYAQGGVIIEVERSDEPNSLHVVTEDQDLASCLAKILLLERMSNR